MLSDHLKKERLHRVNQGWKYLKAWQQAWIYMRVLWWTKPTLFDALRFVRNRFDARFAYRSYKRAHWL